MSHTPGAGPGPIPRPTRLGPFSFLTCSQESPCKGYPSSKAIPPSSSTPISSSTCDHEVSACFQADMYASLCSFHGWSLSLLPRLALCHHLPGFMPQPCLSQRSAYFLRLPRLLCASFGQNFAANVWFVIVSRLEVDQVSKIARHSHTGNAACANHLPCGAFLVLQN